ncbi:3'-5' exonuclease domain-containing protein 2 [bacterium]|jgi:ribonuclease D|nr:3'-5' exonuclease domain-containing protein 2 [bacterium]
MTFQRSILKDEINELPLYRFDGDVMLIESVKDALSAIDDLKKESVLGFDSESRPSFSRGESYPVSLLQLATNKKAYLFRLNKFPMMVELADILANPNIVKTGVAVRDDISALQKLHPFTANNFVELAELAKQKNIENFGLRALTAIVLKKRLSKNAKVSNWARQILSPGQIAYAACDAVVAFEIYHAFIR